MNNLALKLKCRYYKVRQNWNNALILPMIFILPLLCWLEIKYSMSALLDKAASSMVNYVGLSSTHTFLQLLYMCIAGLLLMFGVFMCIGLLLILASQSKSWQNLRLTAHTKTKFARLEEAERAKIEKHKLETHIKTSAKVQSKSLYKI